MSVTLLSTRQSPDASSQPPPVDIVAIHGLYEGALDTWTDPETNTLWLRDLFPHGRLNARILAYGYGAESLASPEEGTADRILPYAVSLIAELCAERELSDTIDRPIIFVCHGFGGILVKRALVFSSTSRSRKVEYRRSIYLSTYAIIFMGTPHNGMTKDAILTPWTEKDAGPSQFMLNLLKRSEMLQEITDQFAPLTKHLSLYCFWEQIASQAGNFKGYIVDQDSAAPAWDSIDRCGVMATHSGMAKFKSSGDRRYRVVLGALSRFIRAAPEHIRSRWANNEQLLLEERRAEAEDLLQLRLPPMVSGKCQESSTSINELYIVPRCSSNYFTGRTTDARILKDKFGLVQDQSKSHEHKVFVIYGLGGSGKTQFCLKYAEEQRERYWGVFWIDASSDENAESGFAYLGQQAGKGATFAAGKHWVSSCSKPWFLVIDNADDPDMDISKYFPTGGNGHILITTRNPGAVTQATIGNLHFRGMDPEEAITLLLKSAHVSNTPEDPNSRSRQLALGIASELGYLALALTHAGATIRRNIYTLEKYLHCYLRHRRGMISYPHIKSADDANIITTWEIPFQRISARESIEYRDAVDVMHIFAFMHFELIPERVFQTFWHAVNGTESQLLDFPAILRNKSVWDEEAHARVRRALRVLYDYSIIEHDPDKGFCSFHPVVHAWARGRLTLPEQKRWLACTAAVLACCIPSNLEASGRDFRRRLLPHIDSCLRAVQPLIPSFPESVEQADEAEKFASVYAENGLWKQARTLQRKVIDFRARILGNWHGDTVQAQKNLGHTYWNLFEIKSAIEVQSQVLKSQWWSRPSITYWATWSPWKPDHISYCLALSDITLTLWLAGRRDMAKRAGEHAVNGLMKHFGPDDPITLSAMFNLARTYLHLEDSKKSHELLVQVVRKRKRFFGPDHPETLMARNELGMCCSALGQMKVAQRLLTNVLGSRKKTLGEEHAYTLWSVNDLSKIMCYRGRPERAVSLLEEIVPVVIRTLGENHVGMFMTQSNLARAYALCKRWNEAEALLHKLTLVIPPDHPDWIHAMSGYIHVRVRLGRSIETEKDCNKVLDIITQTKILALDNPRTVGIAEVLLGIYRQQGRSDEILALKNRVPGMKDHNDVQDNLFAIIYAGYSVDRKSKPGTFW